MQALSPVGDAFRDRLRKFPSLVNCCTIDWFSSWPVEVLTKYPCLSFSVFDFYLFSCFNHFFLGIKISRNSFFGGCQCRPEADTQYCGYISLFSYLYSGLNLENISWLMVYCWECQEFDQLT
jgi:hypothetical protein